MCTSDCTTLPKQYYVPQVTEDDESFRTGCAFAAMVVALHNRKDMSTLCSSPQDNQETFGCMLCSLLQCAVDNWSGGMGFVTGCCVVRYMFWITLLFSNLL